MANHNKICVHTLLYHPIIQIFTTIGAGHAAILMYLTVAHLQTHTFYIHDISQMIAIFIQRPLIHFHTAQATL